MQKSGRQSLSGSDIRCQIGQYSFAEVQAVSYSVTREKAPIYTLERVDTRSAWRSQCGTVALIWFSLDRHGLLDIVYKLKGQFVANVDDICWERTGQNACVSQDAIRASSLVRDSGQAASATIDQFSGVEVSAVSGFKEEAL